MATEHLYTTASPQHFADQVDAAKLRALELRREAIARSWSIAGRGLRSAWHALTARFSVIREMSRRPPHPCTR